MTLWIVLSVFMGVVLGVVCATWWPWSKRKGETDTAFLLRRAGRRAGVNIKLYSPALLHGVLYVLTPVTAIIAMTLREWKAMPEVTAMDVKILWATCLSIAMSNWLAYVSKKWSELDDKKQALNGSDDKTKP